jgi:ureidoacrylate peracid hydrolase
MKTQRDLPIDDFRTTALLVIDVQYHVAALGEGENAAYHEHNLPTAKKYFFDRMRSLVLPNIRALQTALRSVGGEVLFTTVESLTRDGRDRGLDYKISGIFVPKGARGGRVLAEIAPLEDEICLPKGSSSVFNSTNIEYLLRNLGISRLIVVGILTDQCVISAVRDACDRGFLVVVPGDACATYTQERHDWALELTKGYCRLSSTAELLAELRHLGAG